MDQKNLLLAIVLSVAILLGFQYLFEAHNPPAPPPSEAAKPAAAPPPATKAQAPGAARGNARQDRHAAAARLDRPDRRQARRPDPGDLPRHRRPEEPRGRPA